MSSSSGSLSLLGLAMKAGSVSCGVEATRAAIRSGEARLVVVAADAADGQLEKVRRTLAGADVPRVEVAGAADLGEALGREPLTAVAVTDASLAAALKGALTGVEPSIRTVKK